MKADFERFARENRQFLKKYEEDLQQKKSAEQIAETIQQPVAKVEAVLHNRLPRNWQNGGFTTPVSSYVVDNALGGNYRFVYNYFGPKKPSPDTDCIGYKDLFFYISDMLDPFINPDNSLRCSTISDFLIKFFGNKMNFGIG